MNWSLPINMRRRLKLFLLTGCSTEVLHSRLGLPLLHSDHLWSPRNVHPAMLFGLNYPWQNNISASSLVKTAPFLSQYLINNNAVRWEPLPLINTSSPTSSPSSSPKSAIIDWMQNNQLWFSIRDLFLIILLFLLY